MTEQQKELLLTDISARLRYGVKCTYYDKCVDEQDEGTITGMQNGTYLVIDGVCIDVENVRPYLFPTSSMTEEQKQELFYNYIHNDIYFDDFNDYFLVDELWHDICVSLDVLPETIDWFNRNKIDYRGLIPMGLAEDATGKNIY